MALSGSHELRPSNLAMYLSCGTSTTRLVPYNWMEIIGSKESSPVEIVVVNKLRECW